MGRRLSLLCCPCLPRKQRDNLSSRSLYLDQDSSGQDDYSDDDDDYQAHSSLLTSFPPSSSSPNTHHTQPNHNPWPSGLSNGRFSRHSTLTGKRKPNPFRGFTASPEQEDQEQEQERRLSSEGEERDFKPYRDDDDDDDDNDKYEQDIRKREEENNALNNPTATYAQTHHAPYRVSTLPQPFSQSTTTSTNGKRVRPPRNPQGKMAWLDGGEGAEEVIDVDALIAEQVNMPSPFFYVLVFSFLLSRRHHLPPLLQKQVGGWATCLHTYARHMCIPKTMKGKKRARRTKQK